MKLEFDTFTISTTYLDYKEDPDYEHNYTRTKWGRGYWPSIVCSINVDSPAVEYLVDNLHNRLKQYNDTKGKDVHLIECKIHINNIVLNGAMMEIRTVERVCLINLTVFGDLIRASDPSEVQQEQKPLTTDPLGFKLVDKT